MKLGNIIDDAINAETRKKLALNIAEELTRNGLTYNLQGMLEAYKKLPEPTILPDGDLVGRIVQLKPQFYEWRINNLDALQVPSSGEIHDQDIISAMLLAVFSDKVKTVVVGVGANDDIPGYRYFRGIHTIDNEIIDTSYFSIVDVLKVEA